jgi:hypothetical protein
MSEIEICDIQLAGPRRAKALVEQLLREHRAVVQLLYEAIPSLRGLEFSEPVVALIADRADCWRLSLAPRRQLTIKCPKAGGGMSEEARAVWKDVRTAQSRLRAALKIVRLADEAGSVLWLERDPLVQRLVTREARAWVLRADSQQLELKFPDLRTCEDSREVIVAGEVCTTRRSTVTLSRVVLDAGSASDVAHLARYGLTLSKPEGEPLRRVGEYFAEPPQCGDVVKVAARLHRGRLTRMVCGATFAPGPERTAPDDEDRLRGPLDALLAMGSKPSQFVEAQRDECADPATEPNLEVALLAASRNEEG